MRSPFPSLPSPFRDFPMFNVITTTKDDVRVIRKEVSSAECETLLRKMVLIAAKLEHDAVVTFRSGLIVKIARPGVIYEKIPA